MLSSNARNVWDSLVRTIVPLIVGALTTWLTGLGLSLEDEFAGLLSALIMGIFTVLYYLLGRVLEVYVAPKFGWLLGLAKSPTYEPGAPSPYEEEGAALN